MKYIDGDLHDTTALDTDRFFKINSCGAQTMDTDSITWRRNGRPDYHLVLICRGNVSVKYHHATYGLSEGNLFLYEPYAPQHYEYTKGTSTFWMHFAGTSLPEMFSTMKILPGVYKKKFSTRVFEQYRSLIRQYQLPRYQNETYGTFFTLMAYIAEEIQEQNDNGGAEAIWKVVSFINEHFSQKLTLRHLSELSGYSLSRFSHLFNQVTGTSPMAYQRNIQLENACEMLSYSLFSVKDVAFHCGFPDQLYFAKVFRQRYGSSPSEFRFRMNRAETKTIEM